MNNYVHFSRRDCSVTSRKNERRRDRECGQFMPKPTMPNPGLWALCSFLPSQRPTWMHAPVPEPV